ncbi:MAG: hypothetical protein ABIO92_08100 [Chloroflexia bacterium]
MASLATLTFVTTTLSPVLQAEGVDVPAAVYVIWIIVLAVAVLVVLPITVALLHRTLKAARGIERYFAEMRDAGVGVAGNTAHIKALDNTIAVATQILETAGSINSHAATIETTMATRARSNGRS